MDYNLGQLIQTLNRTKKRLSFTMDIFLLFDLH